MRGQKDDHFDFELKHLNYARSQIISPPNYASVC